MRKLIYSMLTSLDLYVEGPDGQFGWATPDAELHKHFNADAATMTTHLYGRRMWETLSAYWPTAQSDPAGTPETREFARYWNAGEHIVFSRSLRTVGHVPVWCATTPWRRCGGSSQAKGPIWTSAAASRSFPVSKDDSI